VREFLEHLQRERRRVVKQLAKVAAGDPQNIDR
jgi:hypothetical protein